MRKRNSVVNERIEKKILSGMRAGSIPFHFGILEQINSSFLIGGKPEENIRDESRTR